MSFLYVSGNSLTELALEWAKKANRGRRIDTNVLDGTGHVRGKNSPLESSLRLPPESRARREDGFARLTNEVQHHAKVLPWEHSTVNTYNSERSEESNDSHFAFFCRFALTNARPGGVAYATPTAVQPPK